MQSLALRYGLYLFAGVTAIFLLSHLMGLSENVNLRILNGVVHLGVLYMLIKEYRNRYPKSINNYVRGTAAAVYAGWVGVGGFAVFIVLFMIYDPVLLSRISAQMPLGEQLTPIVAGVLVLMEGLAVSVIGGYIITRVVDAQIEHNRSVEYHKKG